MSQVLDPAPRTDDDLFARAKAGDQEAWRTLFEACYPKVVRVVRRRLDRPLRSIYDSTDFASDVWKSFAAKYQRFDFPSIESLIAFLTQAAEQKVIDEHRRRHTQKRDITRERPIDATAHGPGSAVLTSSDPTPSQVAQAHEVRDRLLERTAPAQRRIVELKLEGLENDEIAARLGCDVRTVQRVLKALRESGEVRGGGVGR